MLGNEVETSRNCFRLFQCVVSALCRNVLYRFYLCPLVVRYSLQVNM